MVMKELLIIRHAKSSWDEPVQGDHERPLNPRGRQAAPEMGRRLAARGLIPERLVSSDARRARETAERMAQAMGLDDEHVILEPRLYAAEADDCLQIIRELPDEHARLAIVGHNPTLHELADYLVGLAVTKFPTAAVVHARFDVDRWAEVGPDTGECLDFDYPKRK